MNQRCACRLPNGYPKNDTKCRDPMPLKNANRSELSLRTRIRLQNTARRTATRLKIRHSASSISSFFVSSTGVAVSLNIVFSREAEVMDPVLMQTSSHRTSGS
ncbi:hypothetical protein TNCV_2189091 [Trichonephila clavipes]|nr:hypothetical protein TNCV_2189091 [Trichonephila clavipes]